MYLYMNIYQNNIVNEMGSTLKNVFGDSEKRVDIKLLITVNMGCIDYIHDLVVGHG